MNSDFHTNDHHRHERGEGHTPRGFGRGERMRAFAAGAPGFGPGFGGFGPRGFMPPGPQRKRRGDVRLAIISLLKEKPYNGYALIKDIAERSGGTWTPSPGSVYPTLQQLVDEELIEGVGEGRRTEFQLTAEGRAYVEAHTEELDRVWASVTERTDADAGLHESVAKLMGVVHQFRFAATDAQRAEAVTKLDEARRALYGILAD
ncbi:DNA-binding PadR family transcriptional regulator [Conyzicola lurida]|uniref:DNA-binding PadR family transcriptional regulator n=1 Tax=Conyzicola lurida TaxID=1172621 RepID=A0A841ANF6_9MICO|nr:PadR family transcriptional regulator [Conyzicola lurida]MBB5843854.1 DNA-binding PadR family transcriptional regulator [Conyzicola lurida]